MYVHKTYTLTRLYVKKEKTFFFPQQKLKNKN